MLYKNCCVFFNINVLALYYKISKSYRTVSYFTEVRNSSGISTLTDFIQDALVVNKAKLGYHELGYNELGYNEHSVITNKIFSPK